MSYVIYYDTPEGRGEKVDLINYKTEQEAKIAIMEYRRIDRILSNNFEYEIVKE